MENVSNPKLRISIEKTKAQLTPFVKYPRLDVKYLQKPPFLFVHDIVTYVIRNHGFLSGLFTNEELNRNIVNNSKPKRADFLKKLVITLRTVSGDKIPDCNWNKLACGGLPLITNTILRSIANALSRKMSCGLAVKKVNGALEKSSGLQKRKRNEDRDSDSANQNQKWVDEQMETCTMMPMLIDEPNKKTRQLTIWDIDVDDEEFGDNFDAINNSIGLGQSQSIFSIDTIDDEYEKERAQDVATRSLTNLNDTNQSWTPGPGGDLANEFELMDLS